MDKILAKLEKLYKEILILKKRVEDLEKKSV